MMSRSFSGVAPRSSRQLGNPLIGMYCLIVAQSLLFLGLCSMFLYFQFEGPGWPLPGSPRLSIFQPGINLAILVCSSGTIRLAGLAVRRDHMGGLKLGLLLSLLLGGLFLANQIYSFLQLGLPIGSSLYIAILYILVALHAGHIVGGLIFIGIMIARVQAGDFNSQHHFAVDACEIFWQFVVWIWGVLFGLLYLL